MCHLTTTHKTVIFLVLCTCVLLMSLVMYGGNSKFQFIPAFTLDLEGKRHALSAQQARVFRMGKVGSRNLPPKVQKTGISLSPEETCDQCTHKLPSVLIIGTKKGGTGSLLRFMGLHPDMAIPDTDELRQVCLFSGEVILSTLLV